MSDLIQLDSLPVEALAEMANEAAAASLAQWEECKATGSKAVEHAARCGRALQAIKAQLPHGKWASWVEESFPFGIRRSQQFMEIAKAHARALLTNASSFQDALRLMDESPEKQAKKAEREACKAQAPPKSLAPATPAPPVSAGTIRHENPPSQPQRPAWLADPDELDRPEEDDLPPLPKTNTHHTSANRRSPDARQTDRVGIVPPDDPRTYHDGHWYEWNEDRGRMVAVADEEILRRADEIRGQAIVEHRDTTIPVVEPVKEFVSNKRGKVPTLSQLRQAVDAKVEWGDALREAARDWAAYKMTLAGKDKIRSMESWQKALTRMGNVAKDRCVADVCEAIEKAIANGWTGWEHLETSGSRSGSRISTAVRSNRNWDEEIPEWKPTE